MSSVHYVEVDLEVSIVSRVLIVPEPHIHYSNINGRQDYTGEIKSYMNEIKDIVIEFEDIKLLCFIGDIFHRGFNDIDEYFYWVDWFSDMEKLMVSRDGKIYSAVGNHELSFSKGNPFWRLVSSDDGGFNTVGTWANKAVAPKGIHSIIHVEDIIELSDDVSLFFCHYDFMGKCKELLDEHIAKYGDTKKRVCICHNSIIDSSIVRVLRDNYDRDPMTHIIQHECITSLDLFHKFDVVFNGHMHKAFSNFTITDESTGHKTKLFYLGSLGRTNSDEINDRDLIRLIPTVDFNTAGIDGYRIDLLPRKDTLVTGYTTEKVERKNNKEEYENICNRIVDIEKPIKALLDALTDRDMCVALENAVNGIKPPELVSLEERLHEV